MSENFKLADHVSFTELDDEAVLLDLNTGAYYGLNHVGVMLVNTLNNGASTQQAKAQVSEHYGVPCEHLETDVDKLINEMLERQLLQPT